MNSKKSKKPAAPGDVFLVPLASGAYAFGVMCEGNDFAFFDARTDDDVVPADLLSFPIAFRVPVALDSPREGRWKCIGHVALSGAYAAAAKYIHKPIGSSQCYVYLAKQEYPASENDCRNLEVLATWFSFHVEERLEDFFQGRENNYLRAIRWQLGIG